MLSVLWFLFFLFWGVAAEIHFTGVLKCAACYNIMCLSAGNTVPQHLLPYEAELGATVTVESLIRHVCHMEKRPSIPQDWELLSQVSSHQQTQFWLCVRKGVSEVDDCSDHALFSISLTELFTTFRALRCRRSWQIAGTATPRLAWLLGVSLTDWSLCSPPMMCLSSICTALIVSPLFSIFFSIFSSLRTAQVSQFTPVWIISWWMTKWVVIQT